MYIVYDESVRAVVAIPLILSIVEFFIPIENSDDLFVIEVATRITKIIRWIGKSTFAKVFNSNAFSVEQELKYKTKFWQIGKEDPAKRFFGGTFRNQLCNDSSTANASFYRYTKKDGVVRLIDGFKVVGGFDWDTETNTLYIVDVCQSLINAYDWNPKTGNICRFFFNVIFISIQFHF